MFSKLKNVKTKPNEVISITDLVELVKNNPQINLINQLRSLEYGSDEYKKLKLKLNAIMVNGVFSGLNINDLITKNNYLYYDIDGLKNENDLLKVKQLLIDSNLVSFICKSSGGRGLSILIKIDSQVSPFDSQVSPFDSQVSPFDSQVSPFETFSIYKYYFYIRKTIDLLLKDTGYQIDINAAGLNRKMFISQDENLFYKDVNFPINLLDGLKESELLLCEQGGGIKKKYIDRVLDQVSPFDIIPFNDLIKDIRLETEYKKDIEELYNIDEIDYYRIIIPDQIPKKRKHKSYIRMINALYYLNIDTMNQQKVFSFINYINNKQKTKMEYREMYRLVEYHCNNIETTGNILIKTRKRKLHFNKNIKMSAKQKQEMARQMSGITKSNETVIKIKKVIEIFEKEGIKYTQKMVAEKTGLSLRTIKRYINNLNIKEYDLVIKEIEIDDDNNLRLLNKEVIEENDFLETPLQEEPIIEKDEIVRVENFNYKGIYRKDIEICRKDNEYVHNIFFNYFNGDVNILTEEDWNKIIILQKGWSKEKCNFYYNKIEKKYRI